MDVKAKYFLLETKIRNVEAWRFRERRRDGLAGLGGHSAYQEAPEVIFYGGPAGCTPFLSESIFSCLLKSNLI